MKSNILTLTKTVGYSTKYIKNTISLRMKSRRKIDFFETTIEKNLGSYVHHPFVDSRNYLFGAFSGNIASMNKVMLNNFVDSFKTYCSFRLERKVSTILPGYPQKNRNVKGFKFEVWKGCKDQFVWALLKKIEVDFISAHQISFVVKAKNENSFYPDLDKIHRGPIDYKALEAQHIAFLEERVRKQNCVESMEKLEKYLENTNKNKLKYYRFINSLHKI